MMGSRTNKRKHVVERDRQAFDDLDYWKSLAHNGWQVLGFTDRESCIYVKHDPRGVGVSRSVEIKRAALEVLGVIPV